MHIDGGCHCGAVRYQAGINPDRVVICHCTDCQIVSGSAFRTVVQAKAEDFKLLQGSPKIYIKTGESGNRRALAFCADCGSHVYATNAEPPHDLYGLRVGTIDQRAQLRPALQVWCQSKLDWLDNLPSLASMDKQ